MGRRTAGIPQDPGYKGYTPVIAPPGDPDEPFEADTVTSSTGFLIMGIIVGFLDLLVGYATWKFIEAGDWAGMGQTWWVYLAAAFVSLAVWANYSNARGKERHRAAYDRQQAAKGEATDL